MKRVLIYLSGLMIMTLCILNGKVMADTMKDNAPFETNTVHITIDRCLTEIKHQSISDIYALQTGDEGSTFDIRGDRPKRESVSGRKSPIKAFLYSAAIPGAGQLYTGSKTKALIFVGLEALSWTGYFTFEKMGDNKTVDYEDYANENWSENRYSDWLEMHWNYRDDDLVMNNLNFPLFTHHLPDTKVQQYYEMIGKYNQFVYGWADTDIDASTKDPHPATVSPLRLHYEGMRNDANKAYNKASTSLIVMMANHLVSGFEAALAARRHNKNNEALAQRLSFKAQTARIENEYFPMLTMSYKF